MIFAAITAALLQINPQTYYPGESFAQDGHRVTVQDIYKGKREYVAAVRIDSGPTQFMLADLSTGYGAAAVGSVTMGTSYASCTDPGGGICNSGTASNPVLQLADPIIGNLILTPTSGVSVTINAPATTSAISIAGAGNATNGLITFSNTTGPTVAFNSLATTGAAYQFNNSGNTSGDIFDFQKNGGNAVFIDTNGKLTVSNGSTGNGQFLANGAATFSNSIFETSTTAGQGLVTGNGTVPSYCKGCIVSGSTSGFGTGTTCAQTTSNASPSLVTLTSMACKLTSGSASATVFTITLPYTTFTNAPLCFVQDLAANVVEPTCTVTAGGVATLTYSAAPGAVAFANVWFVMNGP